MYIIVGLGNPTKEYMHTRHNVGFDTIDAIAEKYRISVTEKKHKALIGKGYIEGQKVDYYLDQAGGYSENAKKSKKFIVYMNGQVTKVKGSGKKQIEPGCEIIVPSKAKKRNNIGNILGYATTFSTLGMMVASIANLIKK